MFGLRQTWNDVFPQSKLYALDIKINSIDPGWPITAQLKPKGPPAIHINPNFLKGVPEQTAAIHAKLEKKRQELLELQTRKLELELLATKKRIEEQEKQLSLQADSVAKGLPSAVRKPLENPSPALPVTAPGVLAVGLGGLALKTRIAPVSQSMISMMNSRDPRLLKHQGTGGTNSSQPQSSIAHRSAGGGAAAMTLPPHGIIPAGGNALSETTESSMASKAGGAVAKERLGGRGKRIVEGANSAGISKQEYGSDNGTTGGARLKKMSSPGSSGSSSHKSRHDHHEGGKTRKDRISKDQMSSARSNGSKGSSGSSGSSPTKSSTTARTVAGGEKRKQHGTTSDTSPQGRKSPHTASPGKKKPSDMKISPSSSDGGRSSKHESKTLPTLGKIRKMGTNRGDSVATPLPIDTPSGTTAVAVAQDVDLRYMMPEKRLKIDGSNIANHQSTSDVTSGTGAGTVAAAQQQDVDERASLVSMMGPKASSFDVQSTSSSAQAEEDALSALISKDIDLRKLPLQLIPNTSVVEHGGEKQHDVGSRTTPSAIAPGRAEMQLNDSSNRRSSTDVQELEEYAGGKKRSSTAKTEEPMAKKSKAEMIDALFGNEDVDLRQLPPVLGRQDGTNSPPPAIGGRATGGIAEVDLTRPDKTSRPSRFTDAAKSHDKDKLGRPLLYNKLPDDPIERRRSISSLTTQPGDVDMRQSLHHIPPPRLDQSALDQDEDSSMDSMNANIKTIVAQAQEQMEKGEINLEQYNILMKQVIQLNETQKIRQAQRIEQRQEPPPIIRIDDNGSLSGEDDVIITSATPGIQVPAGPPGGGMSRPPLGEVGVNNFRGKIHPLDGGKMVPGPMGAKPPFESPFVGNTQTSVPPPDHRVSRDPRRMRESKWSRVEPPNATTPAWANRVGPAVGPTGATTGLVRGGINVPSPWEQAPFPMPPVVAEQPANRFAPVNGLAVLGAALPGALLNGGPPPPISTVAKLNDSVRTINIDSIQREIRFYEETAVVFMNWDEPKEIGFQKGARMVVVDDRETFELGFNEPYKSVSIENHVYQMRLGAPTRELYIDDSWYECYFGDPPTTITLDGKQRVFKISGPPPQVKIGESRNDLVAGKINMIIDAELIVPVFLDCKPQLFEINGHQHRLQFADFLLTVLIDEQPFPVEYGGLPKVFRLRERSYYIRFTALPKLVVPGRVYIRDMVRTPLYRDLRTPPKDASLLPTLPPLGGPPLGIGPAPGVGVAGAPVPHLPPGAPAGVSGFGAQVRADTQNASSTGLDYLTNLMPTMAMQTQGAGMGKHPAYRIESDEKLSNSLDGAGAASNHVAAAGGGGGAGGLSLLGNINVGELYKKIVAAGIITNLGGQGTSSANNTSSSNTTAASEAPTTSSKGSRGDRADSRNARMAPIEPVRLDQPDMLRKRQAAIVYQLFSGMQCSSCGVRFPPEQTMKYSQHLDWHFRQNRRDRDSARKAHSRKWYYDVSDWIQYEEIEDLEEREKNWFETQQGAGDHQGDSRLKAGGMGSSGGGSNGGIGVMGGDEGEDGGSATNNDSPQPSCPAGTDEDDRQCHMCHDVFEQFYNEETEDWHLKCAIRIDGYTYHPLCYEDYKASLTMSESTLGNTLLDGTGEQSLEESQKEGDGMDAGESTGEQDDGTEEQGADGESGDGQGNRKTGAKSRKRKSKEGDDAEDGDDNDDDDDDVIVLPTVEPVVEEILDDETELQASEKKDDAHDGDGSETTQKTSTSRPNSPQAPRQPEFQERQIDEDLFIQEPNIEVTDLDDIEDLPTGESARTSAQRSNGAADGTSGGENDTESCLHVKIKEEPKDEDEADEEDALFEDVGTIESSVIDIACGGDHRSPNPPITTTIPMEEDVGEDSGTVEIIPSSPGDSSNQMGATTATATPAQMASKASIDGNVELQDAPQASVVVPNKIKINITTSKSTAAATQLQQQQQQQQQQQNLAANEGDETSGETNGGTGAEAEFAAVGSSSRGPSPIGRGNNRGSRELGEDGMFDELSNDGGSGWEEVEEKDDRVEQQQQQSNKEQANEVSASSASGVAFEETTDVAYELKTGLQGIELNRQPRVTSGYEASGLCSIM
uniref:Putative mrna cleavage and polyadenylation factor i/ii complex subunit pcf11 n=1 Tax=Anopheles triannulatus TaxID=58253 RepID=A0A2M4A1N7_9DIPT